MSDFPELRTALQDAARRRYPTRRDSRFALRLPVRAGGRLALLALALSFAISVVATQMDDRSPRDSEEVTAKPSVTAMPGDARVGNPRRWLADTYSVFGRRRDAGDQLSAEPGALRALRRQGLELDSARLIARAGKLRAFAAPSLSRGRYQLCLALQDGRRIAAFNCHPIEGRDPLVNPPASRSVVRGRTVLIALLPDSIAEAVVDTANAETFSMPVSRNGLLVSAGVRVLEIAWRDGRGRTGRWIVGEG